MMASDHPALHHTAQEDKTSGQCRKRGSSNDSPGRLSKSTISQDSSCSKHSSKSGSAQFTYSNDFHDNASRTAVNGSKNSICSEENICGTSQNYYHKDFHSDSSKASISEESGSYIIPLPETPKTKERNLPEKKKKNDVHTKGGKTLPKKKPPQKKTIITGHTINAQEKKNKIACHLLSATDHSIKELKNEAAVLRNKVETFTTENKILKRLQSRHLKAISKYKNAEINLPDLLATHANEGQTLRADLRKSQENEYKVSKKLREVQAEHLKTTDALRSLQNLCEDKKLEEREELHHQLRSLTQKLEARDKKTQDLEKQLASNTAFFRHKLAVEEKKVIEVQSSRANLEVEIESLKLKLKERERELNITNIYAHRMRKGQPEKADSRSSPKVVKVNKAIQVNINIKTTTLRKPEPYVSPMIFHEELKTNREVKEVVSIAKKRVPETGVHLPEMLPVHNISNRTFMGFQNEEICPRIEKNTQYENIERHKNRRERQRLELLNTEFDILKTKPIEKKENEEDKEAKEAVCDILTMETPSTSKKQYVFSEAIQNLHQGYPSTGPKITYSRRQRNRQQDGKTNLCPVRKPHDKV
ncbi:LOW QUALITY PROTEIN: lebercilin-like protein [Pantherophis guttatus]|uniref:Lebercilin-like protein n=1 Tax=Pantherophis guttatus TaxID=94885 RepID=A0ABM3ZP04_PANGU|nr:LOW QUALITY PROTEIN: lebercilin-like protein [Pantherophis guttatus]